MENSITEYFTANEASNYLRISKSKIYKLTHTCQIKHRKHGSRVVFHRSDLDEWSDRQLETPVYQDIPKPMQSALNSGKNTNGSLKTEYDSQCSKHNF